MELFYMIHGNLELKASFKKDVLLNALRENKVTHTKTYAVALKEYFKDVLAELEKMKLAAESGDIKNGYRVDLQKPINNEKEYDKYIQMFEMTSDEEIVLAVSDFNAIVQDTWPWAVNAFAVNTFYSGKAGI